LQLEAIGPNAEHVLAIARRHKREWALFAAPRWLARAQEAMGRDPNSLWRETRIRLPDTAPQFWENIFTGENLSTPKAQGSIAIDEMFRNFPIALLSSRKQWKASP
jgi:maltooligosyltrehalose synthase